MVADALIYHPAVSHYNKFVATTGETHRSALYHSTPASLDHSSIIH